MKLIQLSGSWRYPQMNETDGIIYVFAINFRYFRQLALLRDTPVFAQALEKQPWNISRAAYLHLLWISKDRNPSYYISSQRMPIPIGNCDRMGLPNLFDREMMNSYRRFRAAVAFKRDWVAPTERVGSTSTPLNLVFVPGAMNNLLRAKFHGGY